MGLHDLRYWRVHTLTKSLFTTATYAERSSNHRAQRRTQELLQSQLHGKLPYVGA